MRVYISGPLSDTDARQVAANVDAACVAWVRLFVAGHCPFCPHINHHIEPVAERMGVVLDYEDWLAWGLSWLTTCDALVCLGDSPGADREVRLAEQLGIPAFDSVDDFLKAQRDDDSLALKT